MLRRMTLATTAAILVLLLWISQPSAIVAVAPGSGPGSDDHLLARQVVSILIPTAVATVTDSAAATSALTSLSVLPLVSIAQSTTVGQVSSETSSSVLPLGTAAEGSNQSPSSSTSPAEIEPPLKNTPTNSATPFATQGGACLNACVNNAALDAQCNGIADPICFCSKQSVADSSSECVQGNCPDQLGLLQPLFREACFAATSATPIGTTVTFPRYASATNVSAIMTSSLGSLAATSTGLGTANKAVLQRGMKSMARVHVGITVAVGILAGAALVLLA